MEAMGDKDIFMAVVRRRLRGLWRIKVLTGLNLEYEVEEREER